jgi:hypothetical protein
MWKVEVGDGAAEGAVGQDAGQVAAIVGGGVDVGRGLDQLGGAAGGGLDGRVR